MKKVLIATIGLISTIVFGQDINPLSETETVVLDNDQVTAVEYMAEPQGNVCGKGMHHHKPHLVVLLSDAKVVITTPEGESQEVEVPFGTTLWAGEETHTVVNTGDMPTKMILVYPKN